LTFASLYFALGALDFLRPIESMKQLTLCSSFFLPRVLQPLSNVSPLSASSPPPSYCLPLDLPRFFGRTIWPRFEALFSSFCHRRRFRFPWNLAPGFPLICASSSTVVTFLSPGTPSFCMKLSYGLPFTASLRCFFFFPVDLASPNLFLPASPRVLSFVAVPFLFPLADL